MTLFYVLPPEDLIPKFIGKELLLRIKAGRSDRDCLAYLAFRTKEIGKKYLNKKMPGNNLQLVAREELQIRGIEIDPNHPTLYFETKEQVEKAFTDKNGNYLSSLLTRNNKTT